MNEIALRAFPFCGGNGSESAPIGMMKMVECRKCMAMALLHIWNSRQDSKLTLSREKLVKVIVISRYDSDFNGLPTQIDYDIADAIKAKEAELREGQNETRLSEQ